MWQLTAEVQTSLWELFNAEWKWLMTHCSCLSKLRRALQRRGVLPEQDNKHLNLHGHQKHRSGTSQLCLKSLQAKLCYILIWFNMFVFRAVNVMFDYEFWEFYLWKMMKKKNQVLIHPLWGLSVGVSPFDLELMNTVANEQSPRRVSQSKHLNSTPNCLDTPTRLTNGYVIRLSSRTARLTGFLFLSE